MNENAQPQPKLTKIMLMGLTPTTFEVGGQVVDPLSTTGDSKAVIAIGKVKGGSYRIDYDDGTFDMLCHAPVICRYEDIDGIKCAQCEAPVSKAAVKEFEGRLYCESCAIPLQRKKRVADAREAEGRVPSEDEDVTEEELAKLEAPATVGAPE